MTHMNIAHPDKHQFGDYLERDLTMLKAELEYTRRKYERACEDLRSIIERCEAGEDVYVEMADGSVMHLVKRPEPDR